MSKMVSLLIEVPANEIKVSKCGNYYNLPESVQINKMEGIKASAYIYRSRLVIKKDGGAAAPNNNKTENNNRIENLEASVGKLTELMLAMVNNNKKAKTKA